MGAFPGVVYTEITSANQSELYRSDSWEFRVCVCVDFRIEVCSTNSAVCGM